MSDRFVEFPYVSPSYIHTSTAPTLNSYPCRPTYNSNIEYHIIMDRRTIDMNCYDK